MDQHESSGSNRIPELPSKVAKEVVPDTPANPTQTTSDKQKSRAKPRHWIKTFMVPPIIGEVTKEDSGDCSVVLIYVSRLTRTYKLSLLDICRDTNKVWHTATSQGNRGIVKRIVIKDVQAEKHYLLRWSLGKRIVYEQRLSTHQPTNIAFVCCDMMELDTKKTLWSHLRDNSADIIFHIGDNIYGDYAWQRGVVALKTDNPDILRRKSNDVRRTYQRVYHETWQRWAPKTKNGSHMMVWDDHDVTNGYCYNKFLSGHEAEDHSKRRVTNIGETLYQEYQLSLFRHPVHLPSGSYTKWLDHDTLVYLAPRNNHKDGRPLTGELLEDIKNKSSRARRLIIAFTTAPLPRATGLSFNVYKNIYGTDGLWKTDDAVALYNFCFDWLRVGSRLFGDPDYPVDDVVGDTDGSVDGGCSRHGKYGNRGSRDYRGRQIMLVGGDIHIGVEAVVTNGDLSFPIFVNGPISNAPTVAESLYANALRGHQTFDDITINIKEARATRNYMRLNIPTFTGKLVWSECTFPKHPSMLPIVAKRMLGIMVGGVDNNPAYDNYDQMLRDCLPASELEKLNVSSEANVLNSEEEKILKTAERGRRNSKEKNKEKEKDVSKGNDKSDDKSSGKGSDKGKRRR